MMLAALATVAALSLPRGAKIIEIEQIPPSVRKDRALVLWMKPGDVSLHPRVRAAQLQRRDGNRAFIVTS